MRILLTNDDGIDAFGLKVLYDIASALSDDVWVCAPMLEQSGKGRGVSLHDPVRVRRLGERRFAAGGTPTEGFCFRTSSSAMQKRQASSFRWDVSRWNARHAICQNGSAIFRSIPRSA